MNEKADFSKRLAIALQRAGVDSTSPTKLAIAFNLKHRGQSVSTQAVHKWLSGTAIPGQDKILTFAKWLRVTPEWLRYGDTHQPTIAKGGRVMQELPPYQVTEESLVDSFARLSDDHKEVVCGVVTTLLHLEAMKLEK